MAELCLLLAVIGLSILTAEAVFPWNPDFQPVPVNPVNPIYPYPYQYPSPTLRSLSKCNSNVMNAIKSNFWSVYGVPRNIISTAINNGKEIGWKTTNGYFPDQPYCAYTYFGQSQLNIFKVSGIGLSTTTTKINIIELTGSLYDPDSETLRVMIMAYNGVTLIYTCSLADSALDGPADGLIKYRELNSDLYFAYYQAPQLMASIGIQLTDEYARTC